jgi:glycosyltransferase involved in cell wall biosynthesis
MIRALPVVVTEAVGASEFVKASGGGVVLGIDHRQLVAALSVLKPDELLAAMGEAGAKYAREQLTWNNILARFEDMYQEISGLSGNSRQPRQMAGT